MEIQEKTMNGQATWIVKVNRFGAKKEKTGTSTMLKTEKLG